jgi:hypothetical protein
MMITYQHERFIRQAIESVLAQQTSFAFELVIGEDCSPDRTREIVRDYSARRPDLIRPLLHERNVGMRANAAATFAACRGAFVALLEGDDFWTNPHKLQAQVDFLAARPDCALCYHNVDILDEISGGPPLAFFRAPHPAITTTADLIPNNFIPTCSVLYRRAALPAQLPAYIQQLPTQDWALWLHISRSGSLGYLEGNWACYRVHQGGAWTSTRSNPARQLDWVLRFFTAIRQQFPEHGAAVQREVAKRRRDAALQCLQRGERRAALRIVGRALCASERAPGLFWLAVEAVVGRTGTDGVKRFYRRCRGLAPV